MSENPATVLIIEDEEPILRFLRAALNSQGYRSHSAQGAKEGLALCATEVPDLVILDLGLPDMDGKIVIERLREWSSVPIVILSARDQEAEKVAALDAGADDYVTKPFGIKELLARVRVAIRHASRVKQGTDEAQFQVGDLRVDRSARKVFVREAEVHLTPIEYKLLSVLVQNAGKVLVHRYLLKEVWGPNSVQHNHYLRVFMAALRRKIEVDPARPRYLITEQGVGYRLADE